MINGIYFPDGSRITTWSGPNPDPLLGMMSPSVEKRLVELDSLDPWAPVLKTRSEGMVTRDTQTEVITSASFDRYVYRAPAGPDDDTCLANDPSTGLPFCARAHTSYQPLSTYQWTTTSPMGFVTRMKTDARGRPIEVKPPGSLHPVTLEYYQAGSTLPGAFPGQLATIKHGPLTQPRTTTFKYTPEGWLSAVEAPEGMTTQYVSHDAAGRVLKAILPGGRPVYFSFDADGNLTRVTPSRDPSDPRYGTPAPDGTGWPQHLFFFDDLDLPWTYDAPPLGGATYQTSYVFNAAKQLKQVTQPDNTHVSLGYETGIGRLQQAILPVPAPLSPPVTTTLDYGYDPVTGQLTSVTDGFGEALSVSYQGFLVSGETWRGAPFGSGVLRGSVTVERDNRLQVSRRTIADAGSGSVSYTYAFDEDGVLQAAGDADGIFGADDLSLVRSGTTGLPQAVTLGGIATSLLFSPFGELSFLDTTWTFVPSAPTGPPLPGSTQAQAAGRSHLG